MANDAESPLVTVITATFNSSATLRCALVSLLNQDFQDFEAWIVGDGCTDDSERVVAAMGDARLNWVNLDENHGSQGFPNNEGIKRARGRYVAYLGHDDLWLPWHLGGLVELAQKSGADVVHDIVAMLKPDGVDRLCGSPGEGVTYDGCYIPPSGLLHRRNLVEQIGPWADPKKLRLALDIDFTSRAFRRGQRFEFRPHVGVLKFPSWQWNAYAKNSVRPQAKYLDDLLTNPESLQRSVLEETAALFSRQSEVCPGTGDAARLLFRTAKRKIDDAYGRDRWPLSAYLLWKYQRERRRLRTLRGLE